MQSPHRTLPPILTTAALLVLLFVCAGGPAYLANLVQGERGGHEQRDSVLDGAPDPSRSDAAQAGHTGPSLRGHPQRQGAVSGYVSLAHKPAAGAQVTVFTAEGTARAMRFTATGPDGRFEIAGLPERTDYLVAVDVTDASMLRTHVCINHGKTTDLGSLALDKQCGAKTLTGTIRDETGQPVANAHVELFAQPDQVWSTSHLLLADEAEDDVAWGRSLADVRTDVTGTYRLPAPPRGSYTALVTADGYLLGYEEVQVAQGHRLGGPTALILRRGTRGLTGRIVGDRGRAVSGAMIWAFADARGWAPHASVRSTVDGRFNLRRAIPHGAAELMVRPPKADDIISVPVPTATPLIIRLAPSGTVVIHLTQRGSLAPLADAEVRLEVKTEQGRTARARGRTNAHGQVRLHMRAGQLTSALGSHALTGGFDLLADPAESEPTPDREIRSGRTTRWAFSAPATNRYVLVGRVLDPHGRPLRGAQVEQGVHHRGFFSSWSSDDPHTWIRHGIPAVADETGTYRVRVQGRDGVAQPVVLRTSAPGFETNLRTVPEPTSGATERRIPDTRLRAGITLHGRVQSSAGQPIAGAHVELMTESRSIPLADRDTDVFFTDQIPEPTATTTHATTRADGTFILRGVARAAASVLVVTHAQYVRTASDSLDLRSIQALEVPLITMQPRASLEVSVRGPDGGPTSGARVNVVSLDQRFGRYSSTLERKTDAQGLARYQTLPPGPSVVEVGAPGRSDARVTVTLPTDKALVVQLGPEMRIQGRVLDERGQPIRSVRIGLTLASAWTATRPPETSCGGSPPPVLTSPQPPPDGVAPPPLVQFETVTDTDGRFTFSGRRPDAYVLTVSCSLYVPQEHHVDTSTKPLRLKLLPRNTAQRNRFEALLREYSALQSAPVDDKDGNERRIQRMSDISDELSEISAAGEGPPPNGAQWGSCGGTGSCG